MTKKEMIENITEYCKEAVETLYREDMTIYIKNLVLKMIVDLQFVEYDDNEKHIDEGTILFILNTEANKIMYRHICESKDALKLIVDKNWDYEDYDKAPSIKDTTIKAYDTFLEDLHKNYVFHKRLEKLVRVTRYINTWKWTDCDIDINIRIDPFSNEES